MMMLYLTFCRLKIADNCDERGLRLLYPAIKVLQVTTMNIYFKPILLYSIIIFLLSCQNLGNSQQAKPTFTPANQNSVSQTSTSSPFLEITSQILVLHENTAGDSFTDTVVDMGWLPDGRIYYGIGDPTLYTLNLVNKPAEVNWYSYDSKNELSRQIENPHDLFANDFVSSIAQNRVELLSMTVSPIKAKAIYTRLPIGYLRPTPLPHHYFDPSEIWVATNDLQETFPLLDQPANWYDCGIGLSNASSWFYDETLVIGSCQFNYGITGVYFIADLIERSFQFLNFTLPSGEYIPTEQIAIAHNNPSLAFSASGLWVVPAELNDRKINTELTNLNLLFNDRPAVAPMWSFDDKWIYYWTFDPLSKIDEDAPIENHYWWLERIDPATKRQEIVLSVDDLISVVGIERYRLSTPFGLGNPWKISPDGEQLLLFLSETFDSPVTLFLFSWQQ